MNSLLIHNSEKYLVSLLIGSIFLTFGCSKDKSTEKTINIIGNPDSGVALTFDDAYYDDWIKMLPILKKYKAKVTFFISLNYPQKDNNDKNKILTLYNSGNEIGVHTMDHPHLADYLKQHTLFDYFNNEVLPEVKYLNSLGIKPSSFAYPYGQHNKKSDSLLSHYFNKIRHVYSSAHIIKREQKTFGAFTIDNTNLKEIEDEILNAKVNSTVLVIAQHRVVQKAASKNTFTFVMLDSICKYAVEHKMRFYCLREIDVLGLKFH